MIIADHQILSRLDHKIRWKREHQRFHSRALEIRHGIAAKILGGAQRNACIARRQEQLEPFVGRAQVTARPHHLVDDGRSKAQRNELKEENGADAGKEETEMHGAIKPQRSEVMEAVFDSPREPTCFWLYTKLKRMFS